MGRKSTLVIFWGIYITGILSFYWFFFADYGAITTMIVTFLCGLFAGSIAVVAKERNLVVWSIALIFSPYLLFVFIYLLN